MSDESGDDARDERASDAAESTEFGDRSRANDAGDEEPDDGGEWRFSVDDVGPNGVTEDTATPADEPIEPGDVDLEHAAFVVLGVALTVGTLLVGF
ncbi:hypothetical protein DVK05_01900 [Halorubrum sp. Atlit-8R]|uniref:DUF7312 domain-containing protein n=1 Tax=unclassified Halorubrum TaxID=2642239 RepID=UPI000EF18866|nr:MULTISPECIES: hypothetical protein [unclassified Halorubrum]RLM71283.1 hypothetical protein DVK08_03860 [Halorubrum sp. Atlit-9R]RLM72151.1 hypothetical protein DVK08_08605 [Halorubrum sp. Atlit-9R]RLM82564.1 hypothetical protein DVK05_01900 [Halorubrum sp. Atlit-8R]